MLSVVSLRRGPNGVDVVRDGVHATFEREPAYRRVREGEHEGNARRSQENVRQCRPVEATPPIDTDHRGSAARAQPAAAMAKPGAG